MALGVLLFADRKVTEDSRVRTDCVSNGETVSSGFADLKKVAVLPMTGPEEKASDMR